MLSWFSPSSEKMSAVKCIRALREFATIHDLQALEIIERLELLTGHPDIATYLQDNQWRLQMPRTVVRDIMAEVRLLQQLTDDDPSRDTEH
ncbi:hypothetical protein GCM10011369_08800 [Neiella marina]|uniref:Uncharacterized protein n=1 Tax=Neiella marina TaxID=508461 RepID=A0A8J2U359_9GAMM|nr:hypothetical protein [Neiella marina]GGA69376.1 hypothetical protein GCM10011369_08800 [Neiella marina]